MAKRRRRRTAPKHRLILNRARPYYEQMLLLQQGGCAICGKPPSEKRRLDIDHDHSLMFVRGLLCVRCNRALPGWITERWLRSAADYLAQGKHKLSVLWDDPVDDPPRETGSNPYTHRSYLG